MAMNYAYVYAYVDPTTKMCMGVMTSDSGTFGDPYVAIPVYDTEYFGKYYIDGEWYEDAAGTIPWISSLI